MNNLKRFIRHYFTPTEYNNYKSKLLHIDSLTYLLVAVLAITVLFKQTAYGQGSVLGFATDISTEKLLQLTNDERAKNGLSALTYNQKLANAAQQKAANMFEHNYWAHFGPDGATPWQFILGAGYDYEYAGENLAKNFMYSDGVVSAWMNSPTHRENILRKEYTDVGFAVVNGTLNNEQTTLVVQMFGKPLASKLPIAKPAQAAPEGNLANDNTNLQVTAPKQLAQAPEAQNVLPAQNEKPKVNLLPTYINLNLILFGLLAVALFFDFYFAARMSIVRVSGKNMAHFIFIVFILAGTMLMLKGGTL